MNKLDWSLVHSFLVSAQKGSLSAAARVLGVSQPTLSRDIQALETQTKLQLFQRSPQGLTLTEAGQTLMDAAGRMDEAADLFNRQVSGLAVRLAGEVRISVNEILGLYLLPPAIAAYREQHPGVHIEIVITNHTSSLNKREADIALRMYRPTQPDLVARRLPDLELGFYAHRDYIKQHGIPDSLQALRQHTIIGFDEATEFIDAAGAMGYQFLREHFAIRTDHLPAQINLLRAGAGIAGTHVGLAGRWPELQRILEWVSLPPLEFWIVCHSDTQYNSRIRSVQQFLLAWFADDPYRHVIL